MKTTKFLSAGVMVLLLVGWGMTPGALAHIINGSLGPSAAATDVILLKCPNGTFQVQADVGDNGGVDGIRFGVCVVSPQGRAQCRNAPDGGASSVAFVNGGGPGLYWVTFFKTNPTGDVATVEPYDSFIHCFNSAGAGLVGDSTILFQNQ